MILKIQRTGMRILFFYLLNVLCVIQFTFGKYFPISLIYKENTSKHLYHMIVYTVRVHSFTKNQNKVSKNMRKFFFNFQFIGDFYVQSAGNNNNNNSTFILYIYKNFWLNQQQRITMSNDFTIPFPICQSYKQGSASNFFFFYPRGSL